ncbi:MAG: cytochrome-c peroxidase [Candidatus Schekmanbacteria bacterium]|nr:MAG: cytochrome-c peroxidase [Candidatus Schekmanbacteria bacterium]
MKKLFIIVLICSFVLFAGFSFAQDELMARAKNFFRPIPEKPPVLKDNEATPEKVELGKILFFDPRLSASALISCNTCHNLGLGGSDYQETSTGHGWHRGERNAPTVLNSVFNVAQFWDGRAKDLEEQAKGPVQASVEMNNKPEDVIKTLKSMPEYVEKFKKAFPKDKDPVTFDNMAKAIEVFEATLITPDSKFDRFLKGDEKALSKKEREGLDLYMTKGCSGCHGGLNMGGEGYFPFGLVKKPPKAILAGDTGRYKITGNLPDKYYFKAPSLRNIALTPPYFHSGRVWDLKEAVKIMGDVQFGIKITDDEADKIVAFLKATTGKQPKIDYPILPAPTNATPKPKLD